MLNMTNLENAFEAAKKEQYGFIGVAIKNEHHQGIEVIINPIENFDIKLEYYKKSYNEHDLTLKACPCIKIVGITMGNSFGDIQSDFQM